MSHFLTLAITIHRTGTARNTNPANNDVEFLSLLFARDFARQLHNGYAICWHSVSIAELAIIDPSLMHRSTASPVLYLQLDRSPTPCVCRLITWPFPPSLPA